MTEQADKSQLEQALSLLPPKRRIFVLAYLDCLNATEAARRAEYAEPNKQGPRLLVNVGIRAAVDAGLRERAMGRDEVLARLAEHASGDIGTFLDIAPSGREFWVNLHGKPTRLIKKIKITKSSVGSEDGPVIDTKVELELYDAQSALATLAKHYGLLVDRQEISGPNGGPIVVNDEDRAAAAEKLAQWRQEQMRQLSSMQPATPTPPISSTPTE